MEFSADLIDERVWLGNIDAAENLQSLRTLHITHIVSLIREVDFEPIEGIARLHIRVDDVETTDLLSIFDQCYVFIGQALSKHPENNVLIHCQAGEIRLVLPRCHGRHHRCCCRCLTQCDDRVLLVDVSIPIVSQVGD